MARFPFREADLAEETLTFAASHVEAKPRWLYAHSRVKRYADNGRITFDRVCAPLARYLGVRSPTLRYALRNIHDHGYEGALDRLSPYPVLLDLFKVGPIRPWMVGHVYFARVEDFPHVVKVGFSRRVLERLEDIESRVKAKLFVGGGQLRVGTMADEYWWQREWRATHISGEWFFDPFDTDRTLPPFLATELAAA